MKERMRWGQKAFGWFTRGYEDEGIGVSGLGATTSFSSLKERDARSNSIVMSCINWAMRNVGQAPITVQQETERGWETTNFHPAIQVLRQPQGQVCSRDRSLMTGGQLLSSLVFSRLIDGNAYLQKLRDDRGQVIGLDWLPHGSVIPVAKKYRNDIVDFYEIRTGRGIVRVEREDVIHDRDGVDPDRPILGISRLTAVARQVATDNAIAAYCQSVLKSPAPSLMISAKSDGVRIGAKDAELLAQKIQEKTSGGRAGGVIVPTFPAEISKVGYSPDQMAVETLSRLPEERITAVFGIPAMVLGLGAGMQRSTFNNMREAREAATEEFLVPLWQDIAATLTDQLLVEFGDVDRMRISFDLSSVRALQEDQEKLHLRIREDFKAGLIDRDEARVETNRTAQECARYE